MERFNIIYASIVRFKDKIPLFTYSINIENSLKVSLVQTLNYFFQSITIGAFPGGREVYPFENGTIYSIYNKNLTLIYVVITKREDISDQQVFLFITDFMDTLEDKIDFLNLENLSKNKYSRTFLNDYEILMKKYNADSNDMFENLNVKIVRVLSTIHKGINASLKNKENLTKLQRRMSSLAVNAKMFQVKATSVKKSMNLKSFMIVFIILFLGLVFFLIMFLF